MRWSRHWWIVLFWASIWRMGTAQPTLEARLQQLPVSVGVNEIIPLRAGESWVDIGIREYVGYEHLRRANAGNIASARRLFIPGRHQVPALTADGLVINLPEMMNFRWKDGKVAAWYPISIGRVTARWRTPVGNLRVVSREKNPTWDRPSWAGGGAVPPGPRNPLGDRWVGLSRPGYGLHGTNDPTSIGRYVSHGCIRHFPAHIRQLFDSTRIGMPVIITYQTVTVGADSGVVYMAVFPDIYRRGSNAPHNVRARLAAFGLGGVLTARELEQRLAQADGIARPLLGSTRKVTVNLLPLNTPIGPTLKRGTTYLPLRTIAAALKADVTWHAGTGTATLTRGKQRISFTANNTFTALGTRFVPLRRAVEGLGGRVQSDRRNIRMFIV